MTGAVTYGTWTTGTWEGFITPQVAGYTPSTARVDAATVDIQTKDTTVTITYTANPQVTHVHYVDPQGQAVHLTTVRGVTDQTVAVPSEIPAGWQLDAGQRVPTQVTFTATGYPDATVTLTHQHVTVTPDQPKTPQDALPDNPTKPYPTGVTKGDLNKTITRTIKVVDPHSQKVTVTDQTVHLTRTADVDEVSGAVVYGKWSTGEWAAFTPTAIAGYTPSVVQVAAQVVVAKIANTTVTITYTADAHTTHVNYVDDNGDVVHATKLTGVTDQTIKVPSEVPAGWQLVAGQVVPATLVFGPTGHPDVTVKIKHGHVTVTPDHPKTPQDALPGNPTKPYPTGVAKDDLNKFITRTIKVVDPHTQKVTTTTQTVHLTRTADVDTVTGAVKYNAWTTGNWAAFTTPKVVGYTPSQATVALTPVSATTKDTTVTIIYTADQHTTHVNYVADDSGQLIHTTTLTGRSDEAVAVPNEVPGDES